MKTFEEALKATISLKERPDGPDPEMPMSLRDALDLAREINGNPYAVNYISGLVELSVLQFIAQGDPTATSFHDFGMALALSAFLVGVRVGKEMEKQELEP